MKSQVAVVIPYYHGILDESERISFMQCMKILHDYPVFLVVPEQMNKSEYPIGYEYNVVVVPSEWMLSVSTYNRMMLNIDFYKKFSKYEYILIYQLDAFVFRDDLRKFCDMGYDYIGAPWPDGVQSKREGKTCVRYVGNGGLSLRRVETSISLLETNSSMQWDGPEDVYWAMSDSDKFLVAPKEMARFFSIEQQAEEMYTLNKRVLPFGCHAWEKLNFSFWKPFIEENGYIFSKEKIEKLYWNEENIWIASNDIICKCIMKLTCHKGGQLCFWGAGTIGKEILIHFYSTGLAVRCVDSNENYWGKYIWGVCVESPDILKEEKEKKIVVVATKKYKSDIMNQLSKWGYHYGKNVFFFDDIKKMIKEYWLLSKKEINLNHG